MSGAELKVELTGLGLTPAWLACRLGVTHRTIIRWFDLDQVPGRAVAEVAAVGEYTDEQIRRMLTFDQGILRTHRTDRTLKGGSGFDPLPAAWHRSLTYRAMQHLRQSGIDTRVAYIGQP